MAKTFKTDTTTFEKTTRAKRYGDSRKLLKENSIRERRKANKKLTEAFEKLGNYDPTD